MELSTSDSTACNFTIQGDFNVMLEINAHWQWLFTSSITEPTNERNDVLFTSMDNLIILLIVTLVHDIVRTSYRVI